MDPMGKLLKFAQINKHVRDSLEIIEKSILKYKVENTCISFNGGKDCTAILHLIHSVYGRSLSNNNNFKLVAFYAQLPDHFEEESEFVQQIVKKYDLKLMQYSNRSLRDSLFQLKADAPHIEAIYIGTRRDDLKPGMKTSAFAPTDDNWPEFMRINPILDWSYSQVWDFIRELEIPYCDLYNQGYSSLGTKNDTQKNSSLMRYNEQTGERYYLPAWQLIKSNEERLHRSTSLDVENKDTQLR